ncbi:MAG: nucleotide exchange factor GrpE [Ginsengibacter sp.]
MQDHKKRNRDSEPGMTADSSISEQIPSVDEAVESSEVPLQSENDKLKLNQELEESKDKYLRLFAEFENYKRRTAKERMELIQTAGKDVISSLLPVLDDSERAEKQLAGSEDIDQLKEGVLLVFNKLRNTLQSKGLKPMESIDKEFDVEKHEAIAEIDIPDPSKKGKVVDEVEKGYYLNDKLIRFAKVIVGK